MPDGGLRLGRILVVDDEPGILRVVKQTLAGIGFDVVAVEGGSRAMELLQEQHFDLVITDLFMPEVSGEDLLETIRQARLDTDVMVMSGAGSIALAVETMKHGARTFLEKPFKTETLRKEVRAVFNARANQATMLATPRVPSERPSMPHQLSGQRLLGRYELRRQIGEGGMGRVYEAFDPNLQRSVAIKVMLPERDGALRGEYADRFKREAWVAGQLVHPHIAAVYDCGVAPGGDYDYLVMEMAKGGSLRSLLDREGRLPVPRTLDIAYQTACALQHAHQHQIVHRDVKPENILFGEGDVVKLVDFGIAKIPTSNLTGDRLVGSPAYLAPELVHGRNVDYRSDQFALGTVMIEMLSGESPFGGGTLFETLHRLAQDGAPKLRDLGVTTDEQVETLVARLQHKDPGQRFNDEQELVQTLYALSHRPEMAHATAQTQSSRNSSAISAGLSRRS